MPSGSAGKAFVSELAHLFQAYADDSSLEGIAMIMSHIFKDKWNYGYNGDILALLDEGKCIQRRLGKVTSPSNNDTIARIFRDLMLQGKFKVH